MKRPPLPILIGLLSVASVWALSNSLLLPILPQIRTELGITSFQAGLLITALSVPTGLLLPLAGFLSDRFSRRAIMVPGLLLYGIGGLIAGFGGAVLADPYPILLLGRAIQGIGASGTNLVAMTLAGDLCSAEARGTTLGDMEAANSLGKLLSPLLGAGAALIAWYLPFFIYPLVTVPLAVAIWFLIPPDPRPCNGQSLSEYTQAVRDHLGRKSLSLTLTLAIGGLAIFLWFGGLFLLAETLETVGVRGLMRGVLLALPVLALIISSSVSGRYIARVGALTLVRWGMVAAGGFLILLAFLPPEALAYGGLLGLGAGLGATLPALGTLTTSCVPEAQRGLITASYGSVRSLGSALGPPGFALIMRFDPGLSLFIAGAVALVGAGLSLGISLHRMIPYAKQ